MACIDVLLDNVVGGLYVNHCRHCITPPLCEHLHRDNGQIRIKKSPTIIIGIHRYVPRHNYNYYAHALRA